MTYDLRKKEAFETFTVQLCRISEIRYKRAIFLEANVLEPANDSAMHSQISSAEPACSMQKIIASAMRERSGVIFLRRSSRRSRCLKRK